MRTLPLAGVVLDAHGVARRPPRCCGEIAHGRHRAMERATICLELVLVAIPLLDHLEEHGEPGARGRRRPRLRARQRRRRARGRQACRRLRGGRPLARRSPGAIRWICSIFRILRRLGNPRRIVGRCSHGLGSSATCDPLRGHPGGDKGALGGPAQRQYAADRADCFLPRLELMQGREIFEVLLTRHQVARRRHSARRAQELRKWSRPCPRFELQTSSLRARPRAGLDGGARLREILAKPDEGRWALRPPGRQHGALAQHSDNGVARHVAPWVGPRGAEVHYAAEREHVSRCIRPLVLSLLQDLRRDPRQRAAQRRRLLGQDAGQTKV
mmetsp:Transcript_27088/g.78585  ORF Transcript_27088/g.78585 Transcript_27088/m.78585 type:complete len:328 (+) Transcript_27088:284-1267(+)